MKMVGVDGLNISLYYSEQRSGLHIKNQIIRIKVSDYSIVTNGFSCDHLENIGSPDLLWRTEYRETTAYSGMKTNFGEKIDLGHHSFLLVDPNRYERTLLRSLLLQLQAKQIVEVNDAVEAAKVLQNEKVDFMMLEYDLPRINGIQFVHGVRRGKCGRNNIEMSIFMLSSRRDAESVGKASNCGIHFFIAKPFSLQTMRDRINTTLTKQRDFIRAENYVGPDRRWRERDDDSSGDDKPMFKKPVVYDMTKPKPKSDAKPDSKAEAQPEAPPKSKLALAG